MNQEEREAFFKEEETLSTLAKAVSGPLGQTAPHGNLERSFVGEKWFYYGETTDEYSLYCDEVVDEDMQRVYIMIKEGERPLLHNLVAMDKITYEKRYPVQSLFMHPMQEAEARMILRKHFSSQH